MKPIILSFFLIYISAFVFCPKADSQQVFIPMINNPTMFGGGSGGFGVFFISMIKVQQYELLLKFTAKGTLKRYGEKRILELYQEIRVAYKLKQVSVSRNGDTATVNYTVSEYATRKIKTFILVVEQDSVKLVIKDMKTFLK